MNFKRTQLQVNLENRSAFPISLVWENAKDLEHVSTLHQRTNTAFELLYIGKESELHEYDIMIYGSQRNFFGIPLRSNGFRKIISVFNLIQIEKIPFLGTTIALNSLLRETGDPKFPTLLLDEVIVEGPWWLQYFKGFLIRSLKRHTAIQCAEDEAFRARRLELIERGINLPYRIFSLTTMERLSTLFKENLTSCKE